MELRERARVLAAEALMEAINGVRHRRDMDETIGDVQAVLLQFAREALMDQPDAKMLDSGVAFALNVTISGDYKWTQYVGDMWQRMSARRVAHLSADEAGEGR